DSVPDVASANDQAGGQISIALTNSITSGGLPTFDLSTQSGARSAIPILRASLENVEAEVANLGAIQSRIQVAMSNLNVATEDYAAASSRIMDVDVADERSGLLRSSILQQTGQAVLAQANQFPTLLLSLLRQNG